jgi:hypothetical protein
VPKRFSLLAVPADALGCASVDLYLRALPEYWRRLRGQVVGADIACLPTEWGACTTDDCGAHAVAHPGDAQLNSSALGLELARRGHTVVVGAPPNFVDLWADRRRCADSFNGQHRRLRVAIVIE